MEGPSGLSYGHVDGPVYVAFTHLTFKASRSNSIYGGSNTVQPASITVNYFIRAR